MSDKPWEVWDDPNWRAFATLKAAERYARRKVAAVGRELEICHDRRTVAYVRPDALGRVWTDVVDSAVA